MEKKIQKIKKSLIILNRCPRPSIAQLLLCTLPPVGGQSLIDANC
jgi:hypothetical protein